MDACDALEADGSLSAARFDDEVLAALDCAGPRSATYVIRNWLASRAGVPRAAVPTEKVLRPLRRMERTGTVRTVPSSYMRQLAWARAAT